MLDMSALPPSPARLFRVDSTAGLGAGRRTARWPCCRTGKQPEGERGRRSPCRPHGRRAESPPRCCSNSSRCSVVGLLRRKGCRRVWRESIDLCVVYCCNPSTPLLSVLVSGWCTRLLVETSKLEPFLEEINLSFFAFVAHIYR